MGNKDDKLEDFLWELSLFLVTIFPVGILIIVSILGIILLCSLL